MRTHRDDCDSSGSNGVSYSKYLNEGVNRIFYYCHDK